MRLELGGSGNLLEPFPRGQRICAGHVTLRSGKGPKKLRIDIGPFYQTF